MANEIKVSIGAALSSGFSAVFNSAEKNVDTLGKSVDNLKQRVGDVGSHRRLQAETLALGEALDQAKKKTSDLRTEMARSEKPTKAQAKAVKDAEREELKLANALDKKTESLKLSSDALRSAGVDTSRLADEEKRLTAELDRQKRVRDSMRNIKDILGIGGEIKTKSIGQAFGDLRNSASSAFRDLAIGGIAAGASMFMLAKSTSDAGDKIAKTAKVLGLSGSALQELRFAADRSGIGVESFDKSMQKMVVNIGKARKGTGETQEALRRLGLNARQLSQVGPEKALYRIAERMQLVRDPTTRATLAFQIFGKEGVKMGNLLAEGSKGMNELRQRARDLGLVISDQGLNDSEVFNDALTDLNMAMMGLRNTIGVALMPAFSTMFTSLSDWVASNQPKIQAFATRLADGFAGLAAKIPAFVDQIGGLIVNVFKGVDAVASFLGGWDNLAIALAGLRLAPVAMDMFSLGQTIFSLGKNIGTAVSAAGGFMPLITSTFPALGGAITAVGAAIMATPIGWLLGGLALVAGSLFLIWKYWDYIAAFASGALEGISQGLRPVLESLSPVVNLVGDLFNWFSQLLTPINATSDGLASATSAGIKFGKLVGEAINGLLTPIRLVADGIGKIGSVLGFGGDDTAKTASSSPTLSTGSAPITAPVPVPPVRPNLSKTETHNTTIRIDGSKSPDETAKKVREEMERARREKAAMARGSYADRWAY